MRKLFSLFNVVTLILLVGAYLAFSTVQKTPPTPEAPRLQLAEKTAMKVAVYFTDQNVQRFIAENRTIQVLQKNPRAVAQAALQVWASGPAQEGHLAAVPKGTVTPKVYLRGLHYFVDLPASYAELRYGTSGERALLCTITRTLLESRGDDVTFLLNSQNVDTLGHLDLREPFTRQDCADQ